MPALDASKHASVGSDDGWQQRAADRFWRATAVAYVEFKSNTKPLVMADSIRPGRANAVSTGSRRRPTPPAPPAVACAPTRSRTSA